MLMCFSWIFLILIIRWLFLVCICTFILGQICEKIWENLGANGTHGLPQLLFTITTEKQNVHVLHHLSFRHFSSCAHMSCMLHTCSSWSIPLQGLMKCCEWFTCSTLCSLRCMRYVMNGETTTKMNECRECELEPRLVHCSWLERSVRVEDAKLPCGSENSQMAIKHTMRLSSI